MKSVFPLTMLAIMAVMITSVMSRDMSSHRSYRGELLFCSIFKTLIVYLSYDLRLHQQKYARTRAIIGQSNTLQFIVYSSIYLCFERLSRGGVGPTLSPGQMGGAGKAPGIGWSRVSSYTLKSWV